MVLILIGCGIYFLIPVFYPKIFLETVYNLHFAIILNFTTSTPKHKDRLSGSGFKEFSFVSLQLCLHSEIFTSLNFVVDESEANNK
jgi:hypothetical protein